MIANTQLRIKEETYSKVKAIAENQQRSINQQINFIIEQFVKDYEKVNGKIEPEAEK